MKSWRSEVILVRTENELQDDIYNYEGNKVRIDNDLTIAYFSFLSDL